MTQGDVQGQDQGEKCWWQVELDKRWLLARVAMALLFLAFAQLGDLVLSGAWVPMARFVAGTMGMSFVLWFSVDDFMEAALSFLYDDWRRDPNGELRQLGLVLYGLLKMGLSGWLLWEWWDFALRTGLR